MPKINTRAAHHAVNALGVTVLATVLGFSATFLLVDRTHAAVPCSGSTPPCNGTAQDLGIRYYGAQNTGQNWRGVKGFFSVRTATLTQPNYNGFVHSHSLGNANPPPFTGMSIEFAEVGVMNGAFSRLNFGGTGTNDYTWFSYSFSWCNGINAASHGGYTPNSAYQLEVVPSTTTYDCGLPGTTLYRFDMYAAGSLMRSIYLTRFTSIAEVHTEYYPGNYFNPIPNYACHGVHAPTLGCIQVAGSQIQRKTTGGSYVDWGSTDTNVTSSGGYIRELGPNGTANSRFRVRSNY